LEGGGQGEGKWLRGKEIEIFANCDD
jgi:hypothetical protein